VGGGVWRAYHQGVFRVGEGPAYEPWKDWRNHSSEGALTLVRAAILAASPHNTQPWLFKVTNSSADDEGIAAAFEQLGFRTRDGSPQTLITLANLLLGNTVRRGQAYADKQLIEEFSEELPRALRVNPIVEVPADVLLVTRVMGLLSGLGKTLDSRVDLFATIMPYAQRLLAPEGGATSAAD
jgi:hypothetical protein